MSTLNNSNETDIAAFDTTKCETNTESIFTAFYATFMVTDRDAHQSSYNAAIEKAN